MIVKELSNEKPRLPATSAVAEKFLEEVKKEKINK